MTTLRDSYFTVYQASQELNVTRQTISRWIAQGRLTAEQVGRERLIPKKDVYRRQRERTSDSLVQFLVDHLRQSEGYVETEPATTTEGEIVFVGVKENGTRERIVVPLAALTLVREEGQEGRRISHIQISAEVTEIIPRERSGTRGEAGRQS